MKIANNAVVTICYKLQHNDATGDLIQETTENEPFAFLFGHNQVLPQFETSLVNQEKYFSFEFKIPCSEGYGQPDPQAITELPINLFMKDGELLEFVKVGNFLPMNDHEGNQLQGLVLEIKEDMIKMDFNHPLAGIDLYFSGKVLNVRQATAEELNDVLITSHNTSQR